MQETHKNDGNRKHRFEPGKRAFLDLGNAWCVHGVVVNLDGVMNGFRFRLDVAFNSHA